MLKIRHVIVVLAMLLYSAATPAEVSVGVGIRFPHVSIGINLPAYPELHVVPGYPVYYAPQLEVNYFFYDGMYWVYQDDHWYVSFWFNGPWDIVEPVYVPVYILRIPVRYYRHPPPYFHDWPTNAPPRWAEHWGHDWEKSRSGWDKWDQRKVPRPAPPPAYQRQYSGERYPGQVQQQRELLQRNYRYQPRDPVVKKHYQERGEEKNGQSAGQGQGPGPGKGHGQGKEKERGN